MTTNEFYKFIGNYFKQRKYEEGISEINNFLKKNKPLNFPEAFFCKGLFYWYLEKYEEAIIEFDEAVKNSPNQIYPNASYYKGLSLSKIERHKEAILEFDRAIENSPNKKYPNASNEKGVSLVRLKRFREALTDFDKAIDDSKNKIFPIASFDKGRLFAEVKQYEEAIIEHKKAINDSPNGKFPEASHDIGSALMNLKKFRDAILHFTKAIEDSPNEKYPLASYHKGITYEKIGEYKQSLRELKKAINDSTNEHFPLAHLQISKIYLRFKDIQNSKIHAYEAIFQDEYNWEIIEHIKNNFAENHYQNIYQNRLNYLELKLITQVKDTNKINELRFIQNENQSENDAQSLFLSLLKNKLVHFSHNISYQNRLKIAYLSSYINNEPWQVFYIIDYFLDRDYQLDEMDYYFYLISAYLIGEPISELKYFLEIKLDEGMYFGRKFKACTRLIEKAIQSDLKHDDYLYVLGFDTRLETNQINKALHPWVKMALNSISISDKKYNIPLSRSEILGMYAFLLEEIKDESIKHYEKNIYFVNLLHSLNHNSNYEHLIGNIRKVISNGIPFNAVLTILFLKYFQSTNQSERKKIAILQACSIISHYVDFLDKPMYDDSKITIPVSSITSVITKEIITVFFLYGMIGSIGLSIALSIVTNTSFNFLRLKDKKKKDKLFEKLLRQIDSINTHNNK